MIELNLTYEESKKILELGYDFGYICYEYQDRADSYPCIPDPNESPEGIPIIPKAALEECLPDKLDVASLNNYVIVKNCVFVKNIDLKTISLSYFFEDYHSCYAEQIEFNSTFEAFLWCHEKYPEELKKKFKEVMG